MRDRFATMPLCHKEGTHCVCKVLKRKMPLTLWWDEGKLMFHQVGAQAAPATGEPERPRAKSTAAIRKITPIVKSAFVHLHESRCGHGGEGL